MATYFTEGLRAADEMQRRCAACDQALAQSGDQIGCERAHRAAVVAKRLHAFADPAWNFRAAGL